MRCDVVAVGTELLLGQIVDTNSAWIGEHLALIGVDSHFQTKVGDNQARIVLALREALARSDAVVVCGGLGPTQDDITRDAIAEVMNVPLHRDAEMIETIRGFFGSRGREMADSNMRQADIPEGATFIPQTRGTAPGLICPVGHKVVYAVPGVPHEMREMMERAVLPDLKSRSGEQAVIISRTLRTWGLAESTLAEMISARVDTQTNPTIAFLASGIEGIKVRLTAKAPDESAARELLAAEEKEVRALLGDIVFGVDDETMEDAVATLLKAHGLTLGVAESLTGGLVGARLTEAEGATDFFRGSVVAYDSEVKFELLGVPEGPVVSEEAARAMAEGAAKALGADVGLGVTGVAGPAEQEGKPVGTVFMAVTLDGDTQCVQVRLPGQRDQVRQFACISLLDFLRRRLLAREQPAGT
ncbi:MAG TPA: competence/damage-inducible protein A [Acidimicrobiales bacterium]|nr:competence/damage-inducible protein A [Acidimicrobiales bacterium]